MGAERLDHLIHCQLKLIRRLIETYSATRIWGDMARYDRAQKTCSIWCGLIDRLLVGYIVVFFPLRSCGL